MINIPLRIRLEKGSHDDEHHVEIPLQTGQTLYMTYHSFNAAVKGITDTAQMQSLDLSRYSVVAYL
jgi:hypothetical protein